MSIDKLYLRALAAAEPAPTALVWKTRKTEVTDGPYSKAIVTEHYTTDGSFSIVPTGRMIYARSHGVRGQKSHRFSWKGFKLIDYRDVPAWKKVRKSSEPTMKFLKRAAEQAMKG
jgi:hypothetical protein